MQTRSDVLVLAYEAVRNEQRRLRYELRRAAWRYAQGLGYTERPRVLLEMKGGKHVEAA